MIRVRSSPWRRRIPKEGPDELRQTWAEENLPTLQIEEIRQIALGVFEDTAKASKWLQRPNLATFNKPPISLVGTPEGFDRVKQVLMRIETGDLA